MPANYTVPFLKKSNARLIVVCNMCYYYVSIFSQTNCKNKVNYFLGLILVAAPRATKETKSFYWGREKHESCEASHDFASLVYNPVVSNLYQMKAIPAASFGTLPSSFQVIVPHRPAQPSCFSLSYLVRISIFFQFNSAPKINHKSPNSHILSTGWLSQ